MYVFSLPVYHAFLVPVLQLHEIFVPESRRVPVQRQLILTEHRPNQAELLGLVLDFKLADVHLVVGDATRTGVSAAAAYDDSIPSFLIGSGLGLLDGERGTNNSRSHGPFILREERHHGFEIGAASVKVRTEILGLHSENVERSYTAHKVNQVDRTAPHSRHHALRQRPTVWNSLPEGAGTPGFTVSHSVEDSGSLVEPLKPEPRLGGRGHSPWVV